MALKSAGSVADLVAGPCSIDLDGVKVLLLEVDGEVRAASAWCTHARTLLTPSTVDADGFIECPLHGAIFSTTDGSLVDGPTCDPLPIYPVTVSDDGDITVDVPEAESPEPAAASRQPSARSWGTFAAAAQTDPEPHGP